MQRDTNNFEQLDEILARFYFNASRVSSLEDYIKVFERMWNMTEQEFTKFKEKYEHLDFDASVNVFRLFGNSSVNATLKAAEQQLFEREHNLKRETPNDHISRAGRNLNNSRKISSNLTLGVLEIRKAWALDNRKEFEKSAPFSEINNITERKVGEEIGEIKQGLQSDFSMKIYKDEYEHLIDVLDNPVTMSLIKKHFSGEKLSKAEVDELSAVLAFPTKEKSREAYKKLRNKIIMVMDEFAEAIGDFYFPKSEGMSTCVSTFYNANSEFSDDFIFSRLTKEQQHLMKMLCQFRAVQVELYKENNQDEYNTEKSTAIGNISYYLGRTAPELIERTQVSLYYTLTSMLKDSLKSEEAKKRFGDKWSELACKTRM